MISKIKPAGVVLALSVLTPLISVKAHAFDLVTSEEYGIAVEKGENPANDFVPKAVAGGPLISVVAPEIVSGSLQSPVNIEVQFQATGNADIDMSSLKIFYLMFVKKDITSRILEHAIVDSHSIKAEGAELPTGKHKFLVEISDTANRKSSKKFTVKVDD